MASQKQLIRMAARQARGMETNEQGYLKGSDYKGHPAYIRKSGDHSAYVTHADQGKSGTVTHFFNPKSGKVYNTSRTSGSKDSRIYGMSMTLKSKGGKSSKRASSGHSGG